MEQIDWQQAVYFTDTPLEGDVLKQLNEKDPEIMTDPGLAIYGLIGAAYIRRVTELYGTPLHPKWREGTDDTAAFMTFHSGQGEDSSGHTSMDPKGFGVPRNALTISQHINTVAEAEGKAQPFNPLQRAQSFVAGCAHDYFQLCGRSINRKDRAAVEERGDEYLSALNSFITLRQHGIGVESAEQVGLEVLATQYNHGNNRQAVDYSKSEASILGQELTAGADIVSAVRSYSPWTNFLNAVEMCGSLIQEAMTAERKRPEEFETIEDILHLIGRHPALHQAFNNNITYGVTFVANTRYQDDYIRQVSGISIETVFTHYRHTIIAVSSLVNSLIEKNIKPIELYYILNAANFRYLPDDPSQR